jgi:hypothetical protein
MVEDSWEDYALFGLREIERDAQSQEVIEDDLIGLIVNSMELARSVHSMPTTVIVALGESARMAARWLMENDHWDVDGIHNLLVERQRKYGHKNILTFGVAGLLVRMSDKVARIENMLVHGQTDFQDDLWLDAFIDLVGYGVILSMLMQETFTTELSGGQR